MYLINFTSEKNMIAQRCDVGITPYASGFCRSSLNELAGGVYGIHSMVDRKHRDNRRLFIRKCYLPFNTSDFERYVVHILC